MIYHIYRDAFSEVYTYRYRLTDAEGVLHMELTWPAMAITEKPTRIFFNDPEGARLAHMDWEDRSWWQGDRFQLISERADTLLATIYEHWNIVDRLLLHLPNYRMVLVGGNQLEARGNRYSERLYEFFVLPAIEEEVTKEDTGVWLGDLRHPTSGPTYIARTESPLLTDAPLLLAGLVAVIDLWGRGRD